MGPAANATPHDRGLYDESEQQGCYTPRRTVDPQEWKDDQWIAIDLGEPRPVTGVELAWEHAYASKYALEASDDGRAWREIASRSGAQGGTDAFTFKDLATRHLRARG